MTREPMTQTALWLPTALRDSIRAQVGERGLAAEVRRRLVEWQEFQDAGYRVTTTTTREIKKANWNLTAQGQYVKKYGMEAAELAARAANVRLGATKPQQAFLKVVTGGYLGTRNDGIRIPVNPTYTFEQRLVEKVSGLRVNHFEMTYAVYEMLCDMGLLNNESSPVKMRGFQCVIGEKPLPDEATLAAEAKQAQERSGAIANKCDLCSRDTRYLSPGDCNNRKCPNKLKTQPVVAPTQRRELIFDD